MVAELVDYVVGVDTHRDEHTLALVEAATGAMVAQRTVSTDGRGYARALRFAREQAQGARVWALEGAGHYGAGLARYLSEARRDGARGGPLVPERATAARQGTTSSTRSGPLGRR